MKKVAVKKTTSILLSAIVGSILSVATAGTTGCGAARPKTALQTSIDDLRAAAERRPRDAHAQTELAIAELLAPDGDPARAAKQIARAIKLTPQDPRLMLLGGIERQLHGDPVAATQWMLRALDHRTKRPSSQPSSSEAIREVAAAILEELVAVVPRAAWVASPELRRAATRIASFEPPVAQAMADLLIDDAYRMGNVAAVDKIANAAGCVRAWKVVGPIGPRQLLGFDEDHPALAKGPMKTEYDLGPGRGLQPTRTLKARGCSTHLGEGPIALGGTTVAETFVMAPRAGEYTVRLETPNATELHIDGQLVARLDRRRELKPRVTFHRVRLEAGDHEVSLKVTSRHPNPVVMLSFLPASSTRRAASQPAPARDDAAFSPTNALDVYLRAATAMAQGDLVRARDALSRFRKNTNSPVVLAMNVSLALADPLRTPDVRRDSARRLLRHMRNADRNAWFPPFQLARLAAAEGQEQRARTMLRRAAKRWPKMSVFPITLADLMLNRGWDAQAQRFVRAALRIQPDNCSARKSALLIAERRSRPEHIHTLSKHMVACDARSDAMLRLFLRTRRWDDAETELKRLAALEPPQAQVRLIPARLELARGRGNRSEVEQITREWSTLRPRNARATLSYVDLQWASNQPKQAMDALDEALTRNPAAMSSLRRVRTALGETHALEEMRLDGPSIIQEFERSGRKYQEPQVLVFDYTVVRVFPDRSALALTHNIFRVQSEEAIDDQGEFSVPQSAYLLNLRTIKADGTILEPDQIDGKETVSMPRLQIGDYVEHEYVEVLEPPAGLPKGILGERFYFRSFEIPFDRSELIVALPSDMDVAVDPRGAAPQTERATKDGLTTLRWVAREARPATREPGSVSPREYLPSISWGVRATWRSFADGLRDVLADRDVVDPEAKKLAARIVRASSATPLDKARRLYDWITEHVENNDDAFGSAPAMLADRTGNRARIFHYLLGLAGVKSSLVLVRGFDRDQTQSELADEDTFRNLLVLVDTNDQPVFVSTVAKGAPFGYIPPMLRGQDAMVLEGRKSEARSKHVDWVKLPRFEDADHRDVRVEAELATNGSATLSVVEKLQGAAAVGWRENLKGIAPALLQQRFEEAYVSRLVPGAQLASLDIAHRTDKEKPLELRYTVEISSLGRKQAGRRIVPGLFAQSLSETHARLATRTTPQLVPAPVRSDITVHLKTSRQNAIPSLPKAESIQGPLGAKFEMNATRNPDGVTLKRSTRIPRMRVPAKTYPRFAEFCRTVDRLETTELRVRED